MGTTFSPGALRAFAESLLAAAGVSAEDSRIIADPLVCADMRGIHSHGVGKIGDYLKRMEAGVLDPAAVMTVKRDRTVTALLDAANGFGQVAARRAMDLALDKASRHGLGMVEVQHSNHFGIASYYALMAAARGFIGVSVTNASAGIAPFGAKEKLFGTNPAAIAVPTGSFPVVLDMSSSVVARGKVKGALAAGKDIPLGWARDEHGQPTTDPAAALKGTLEPISGVKGSGIALMVEVLCGVLSGSSLPGDVLPITDTSGPCRTAHMFCAVDPENFIDRAEFLAGMDQTIARIKALTPLGEEVFVPGELEYRNALKADRDGITLKPNAVEALRQLAAAYHIPFIGEHA